MDSCNRDARQLSVWILLYGFKAIAIQIVENRGRNQWFLPRSVLNPMPLFILIHDSVPKQKGDNPEISHKSYSTVL